jgi:hypothetical protein
MHIRLTNTNPFGLVIFYICCCCCCTVAIGHEDSVGLSFCIVWTLVSLHFVCGLFVSGHFVLVISSSGHFVPWSFRPPVISSPGHFDPWSFCPQSFCPFEREINCMPHDYIFGLQISWKEHFIELFQSLVF